MEHRTPVDLLRLAERMKILAEPKRLLILNLLMKGVLCNCELGKHLDMIPSLISHHMRILRDSGLVKEQRNSVDGRWIYYSINEQAVEELNDTISNFLSLGYVRQQQLSDGPSIARACLVENPAIA